MQHPRSRHHATDDSSHWYVYLIRTRLGTLYTGITTDVARRLEEHGDDGRRGAKYLRSKGPFELVYAAPVGSRALALRVEKGLKALPRRDKERIVATRPESAELLGRLGLEHLL